MASADTTNSNNNIESYQFNINNTSYNYTTECFQNSNTDNWYYLWQTGNRRNVPKEEYTSMTELLNNKGVYTWAILHGVTDNNIIFRARRAIMPFELLSKHKNIIRNSQSNKIIAAGEAIIGPDKTVTYNFASGTYMASPTPFHKGILMKAAFAGKHNIQARLSSFMNKQWDAAGATKITFEPNAEVSFIPKKYKVAVVKPLLTGIFNVEGPILNRIKADGSVVPAEKVCRGAVTRRYEGNGGRRKSRNIRNRKTKRRH